MRQVARLTWLALAACLIGSCTKPSRPLSIRFSATRPLRGPNLQDMNCFFVSASWDAAPSANGVPACVGLGRVSALQTLGQIGTEGAALKVPVANKLRIRVIGVVTTESCTGHIGRLFSASARPELYEVGKSEAQLRDASTLDIVSSYDSANTTNLADCDPSSALALTSISPTEGLHRGGQHITLTGAGFEAGTTVTVGGASCAVTGISRGTSLTCVTPNIAAQSADVTVTNPNRAATTLADAYLAFRMVYVSILDGGASRLFVYRQDPDTGLLTASPHQPAAEANAFQEGVIHPSGRWLITTNESQDAVIPWEVNLADGDLIRRTPLSVSGGPKSPLFHSGGSFLFYNLTGSQTVEACTFNSGSGACTSTGSVAWGDTPADLNLADDELAIFARVGSNKDLKRIPVNLISGGFPVGGSAATVFNNLADSINLVFSPTQKVIYSIPQTVGVKSKQFTYIADGTTTLAADPGEGTFLNGGINLATALTDDAFYALDNGSSKVRRFQLTAATKLLSSPSDLPFDSIVTSSAKRIAVDESGDWVFVLRDAVTNTLQVFSKTGFGSGSGVNPIQQVTPPSLVPTANAQGVWVD